MDEIIYTKQFGRLKLEIYTGQETKLEALKEAEKMLRREIIKNEYNYFYNSDWKSNNDSL